MITHSFLEEINHLPSIHRKYSSHGNGLSESDSSTPRYQHQKQVQKWILRIDHSSLQLAQYQSLLSELCLVDTSQQMWQEAPGGSPCPSAVRMAVAMHFCFAPHDSACACACLRSCYADCAQRLRPFAELTRAETSLATYPLVFS